MTVSNRQGAATCIDAYDYNYRFQFAAIYYWLYLLARRLPGVNATKKGRWLTCTGRYD